jgi:glycosyltransferase involved in cell wall biosynthesis
MQPLNSERATASKPGSERILLVAEAANPEFVSVPLVGWSQAAALCERVHGHLVTQVRNRDAIVRAGWVEERDFTALDTEHVARPLYLLGQGLTGGKGRSWTTLTALQAFAYYAFERALWKRFGAAIERHEYDVVHRITPLSPTIPSMLAARCKQAGVPFVLGPLNGGVPWPRGFDHVRRKEHEWLSYVRSAYKLLPGHNSTRRDAAAILVASRDTLEQMPRAARERCFYLPENAIDPARFPAPTARAYARPLRAAFVGRLVPYKGADMLIEAAAPLVRAGKLVVDVIGDGPERARLEALAAREAPAGGITFSGWVQHHEVQAHLARAHVFAFPSVREFGGGVVLEAMALGVVPVVLDYGGPGELVTPRTGFALPMTKRAEIVESFRATLARLAEDPEQLAPLARRGRERVHRHFTWSAKAGRIVELYRWLIDPRTPRPLFPMPIPDDV